MAFIEPMHRNKPNITYLLTCGIRQKALAVRHYIYNIQYISMADTAGITRLNIDELSTKDSTYVVLCHYINGWVNTDEDGDLRRHRAH